MEKISLIVMQLPRMHVVLPPFTEGVSLVLSFQRSAESACGMVDLPSHIFLLSRILQKDKSKREFLGSFRLEIHAVVK